MAALARCVAHLPVTVRRAAISFVDDARMAALHAQFSGDPATTDVLTFAANAPGEPIDCDIAVCVDEAARRAMAIGHEPRRELLLYALHGLLHACGRDDRTPAEHAAMHAEEDRILDAIGVGPVYRAAGSDGAA
jgi:probable rRNA maturation factor